MGSVTAVCGLGDVCVWQYHLGVSTLKAIFLLALIR
jgi:hypothetical protein